MRAKLFFLFIFVTLSFQSHGEEYNHTQKAEAKAHLAEMLKKTIDPFLIIEITGTDGYIQFYNEDPGLLIDLPEVALSNEQIMKAKDYFTKQGIPLTYTTARNPETEEDFELKTWSRIFPPDEVDRVIDIAFGALIEIYGISEDTPLNFVKGWE